MSHAMSYLKKSLIKNNKLLTNIVITRSFIFSKQSRMMTNKIDFVAEFTNQGIFGLSLKTLGSCPHWEVQGQGVTMVQFLHAMSIDCAVSYFLMLPERMMNLILVQYKEISAFCAFRR